MSYKFTLDHTLAIENIHDMITIDIRPDTRCLIVGGDVEIHGYLTYDGSYLTDELGEAYFEGLIPIDITLPYLGGSMDVRPEVASFDYEVASKKSLTLTLEILLNGYHQETMLEDVSTDVMDAWIDPVTKPSYLNLPSEETATKSSKTPAKEKDIATGKSKQQATKKVKISTKEAEMSMDKKMMPSSPLIEAEGMASELPAKQPSTTETAFDEQIAEIVEEVAANKQRIPKLTSSAAALMDELFSVKKKQRLKEPEETIAPDLATTIGEDQDNKDEVIEEKDKENDHQKQAEPPTTTDSVARQFADGESIIKMVYIKHESEKLGGVLDRYLATMDDVWNLSDLADGVDVGDCVMIKYEQPN